MKYSPATISPLPTSQLAIGTWYNLEGNLSSEDFYKCASYLYDSGVNTIDLAEVYAHGNVYAVVDKFIKCTPRSKLIIIDKVFWGGNSTTEIGLSRKHIRDCCDHSLRSLHTDYIDIFLCHNDDGIDAYDLCVSMNILINQGKILHWGTSNFSANRIKKIFDVCEKFNLIPPAYEQPEFNLLNSSGVFELDSMNLNLTYVTWSPLASGLLTLKYDEFHKNNFNMIEADSKRLTSTRFDKITNKITTEGNIALFLEDFGMMCLKEGFDPISVAYKWCLQNTRVSSVIMGFKNYKQCLYNYKAYQTEIPIDFLCAVNKLKDMYNLK